MAKITFLAAGLLMSLALAGPSQAAPDTKPGIAAKPDAASDAEPKPRPEPQAVRRPAIPAPAKQAAANKPASRHPPHRTARRAAPHRALAQTARDQRREKSWTRMEYDGRRGPPGSPYETASGPDAGGHGCDDACRYREWFERYSAWYDRYGRTFSIDDRRDKRSRSAGAPFQPPPDRFYRNSGPDLSERDRLDPWHGYDGRDGLENGY